MKIFKILLFFLIFTECPNPKTPKKNTKSDTPIPDGEIPNNKIPNGKEIYKIFPFHESLKKSNIKDEDYDNFVKQIRNFYDSKRSEINEALRKNPVEALKNLLPRSNDQAIDAVYSRCLIGDSMNTSTIEILKEMFGSYNSIDNDVKKSRRKEIIEWLKRENIVPASSLSQYLFPEIKGYTMPFFDDMDLSKTISTPSEKILNKIKSEIVPLKNGIYCISLCPYCEHTTYRYEGNLYRYKYHQMTFITSPFDQKKMKVKCHNADCLAYDKVIISDCGMSSIMLKDIIVNIEMKKKSGNFSKTLEINGIKYLNLGNLCKNNDKKIGNKDLANYLLNGIDVIITRINT